MSFRFFRSVLFVPEALDGIEAGSFPCRENTENESDADGCKHSGENCPKRYLCGKRRNEKKNQIADTDSDGHAENAAKKGERHRLEKELKNDRESGRADC